MWSRIHSTLYYAELLQKQHDDTNQKQHNDFNQNLHNDHTHWCSHVMLYHMAYAEYSEKQHDD